MAPGTSALKSKCPKCAKPWTASPSGSWDRGSPLENSLLLGQHSSCTLCLLASRLSQGRGPCGVRLSWQSPLQLPICSSFALQGPRKTALRNQEKWEGQCLGRSLPASSSLPHLIQSASSLAPLASFSGPSSPRQPTFSA